MTTGTWRSWALSTPRISTIRKAFSNFLVVLAFFALAFAGLQVNSGQWHATPVLSGSMRPGLQPGDVVVTQRVPITELRVRDVIVFYPPRETERQTVHRIVKLTVKAGTTSITTWGDANLIADTQISSLKGATAYRVVRVIPLLGYPATALQSGNRGILSIGLGAILLVVAAFVLLRKDKHENPPGSADPPDATDPPDTTDALAATDAPAATNAANAANAANARNVGDPDERHLVTTSVTDPTDSVVP